MDDQVNKELFRSVMNYIIERPEEWDQTQWHCGTTACFAGRTQIMAGKEPNDLARLDAMEALNISEGLANYLFYEQRTLVQLYDTVKGLLNDEIDRDGYGLDGYDRYGYDRDGCSKRDRDRDGYDRDGYDRNGLDRDGYDRNGYDPDGYDRNGLDRDGYDRDGYDRDGYDRDGYDRNGLDREGHDCDGNLPKLELL